MIDIPVKLKSNEEIEKIIIKNNDQYLRANTIDWIKHTLPFIVYVLKNDNEKIFRYFFDLICSSKMSNGLKEWFQNNLNIIVNREIDLLEKRLKR